MPLLNDDQRRNLVNYKYKGSDNSYTYKYVLSPFAQWCVDKFTPITTAPNAITFAGLLVSLSSFVLTLIYNPSLQANSQPRWLCIWTALSVLIYQTLDNMDGKQARKTGSSSALGMLFDHGCDAINSVITAFSQAGCFGLGWLGGWSYIATCVYLAFFFQTWEEYYVGEMILPIFNGPSEGLLMSAALALFSGLHPDGPDIWQKEVDLSSLYIHAPNVFENFGIADGSSTIKLGSMVVIFLLIWTWITVISQIFNVTRVAEKNNHSVVKALADTLPFWVFSSATFMWFRNTELFRIIGSAPNVNVENSNLLMVAMLLLGSIMVDMVTHLMLSHICHSPIRSYKRYFAFLIAVLPALACIQKDQLNDGTKFGPFVKDMDLERKFLYIITTLSTIYTCNNLYQICTESANALNIYIFSLGKRKD